MLRSLFSRARNPEERRIRAWSRKTLGITPGDLALYRQALRHSSAVPEDRPDLPDNERLEFLGDAILDAIIGQLLFRAYPDQGEGFMTRMRSKLVSRAQLNALAGKIDIVRVMESNVDRGRETSVPGNALEALIGAIYLDKGFERTRRLVEKLLALHFDIKAIEQEDRDAKSRLLEWGQKQKRRVEFRISEEGGRRGRGKHYLAEVLVDGRSSGKGEGNSKKKAEQQAAQVAYEHIHAPRSKGNAPKGRGRRRPRTKPPADAA